jgi:hypothetical protein
MALKIDDLPAAIRQAKQELRARLPNYRDVFAEVDEAIRAEAARLAAQRGRGENVIPEIQFSDIAEQRVSAAQIDLVKTRGACVIRNVFDRSKVEQWDRDIAEYVERNDLDTRLKTRAEDKYFGQLASSKPQIYGVYWSKPQVLARQAPSLTAARVFLNRLWCNESEGRVHFDPERVPAYADRMRRRPPGVIGLVGALRRRLGRALDRGQFPQGLSTRV